MGVLSSWSASMAELKFHFFLFSLIWGPPAGKTLLQKLPFIKVALLTSITIIVEYSCGK
jgi:hypothetical protein